MLNFVLIRPIFLARCPEVSAFIAGEYTRVRFQEFPGSIDNNQ